MSIKYLFSTLLILVVVSLFGPMTKVAALVENNNKDDYEFSSLIGGTDENGDQGKINELKEKIKEVEKQIENLQKEEKSLKKEIEQADSQISLTELKIEHSLNQIIKKEKEIEKLAEDIADLKVRIENLIDSIAYQEDILGERLRARYKTRENSQIVVIFGSSTINTLIQKTKYLKVMEEQDQKLLEEMNRTKGAFTNQKIIYEDTKKKEEILKTQLVEEKQNLEAFKSELDRQRKDKQKLLEETQNDENKYQALLQQVQSELAALQFAINLPEGDGEEVKKGDIIAFMGNTGCSSGPHVHFGYVKDGKAVDPLPYLKQEKLKWPVDNWKITQYFGENYTFYMNNFGIPGHDALDIISTSQWIGAPIRAARDGVVYYTQDEKVYCPWLNNSLGKGAIIDHGDGERTVYWHIQ